MAILASLSLRRPADLFLSTPSAPAKSIPHSSHMMFCLSDPSLHPQSLFDRLPLLSLYMYSILSHLKAVPKPCTNLCIFLPPNTRRFLEGIITKLLPLLYLITPLVWQILGSPLTLKCQFQQLLSPENQTCISNY